MDARTVLVDTNVLFTASVSDRALHPQALEVFNAWPEAGTRLCTSGQVLREYLVVATRPRSLNGFGLSPEAALENIGALTARMRFLPETERVAIRLRELVGAHGCRGKVIHDANLVATALVARVDAILTADAADLQRFGEWIEILDLAEAGVS